MNISLVIPTIRNLSFLSEWGDRLKSCDIIVVEDHPTKEIKTPKGPYKSLSHYSWADIRKEFGTDEWIFPRYNAGIRSYGFWKAYKNGADIIITLDDDCYPVDRDFVSRHVSNLSLKAPTSWTTTYPHPDFVFTRGIPYAIRDRVPVKISHGLWTHHIDLDGITQKKHPHARFPTYPPLLTFIPKGLYFPMCSMNLAFSRDVTVLMYFLLMGKDSSGSAWGVDRFDDIWAGIFAKKIMDHLGYTVANGSPFVEHRKASDPDVNIKKEKKGIIINEKLWQWVDDLTLTKRTPVACYKELAQTITFPRTRYFMKLRQAMILWAELFA